MFSDNSQCPDCGQQWFSSLEQGHWLYQSKPVESEYCQVFLDHINKADYCSECYPHNPANRSLVLLSFPLKWTLQNLTGWTFEKASHPFLLGPPLLRKRIHDFRVAGFSPALQLILTRTDKTLNKEKLGQNK
ncbi:torsin-1A-interacting protein 2-like [Fukomys damarensis]|uniref:torsin-1A-interacting protein 2-like n=1 Tax=Fukomys damarensis TaxID=885580 RepID=UPI00053F5F41|nr:torsin-1A-interacting protein 2-like [Fukomys damarensis]